MQTNAFQNMYGSGYRSLSFLAISGALGGTEHAQLKSPSQWDYNAASNIPSHTRTTIFHDPFALPLNPS